MHHEEKDGFTAVATVTGKKKEGTAVFSYRYCTITILLFHRIFGDKTKNLHVSCEKLF